MTAPPASAWPSAWSAPSQPISAPANERSDSGIKRVRVKLETPSEIAREARTLYRKCRSGEISPDLAGKLAFLLQTVARLTEQAETAQKLEDLEKRLG